MTAKERKEIEPPLGVLFSCTPALGGPQIHAAAGEPSQESSIQQGSQTLPSKFWGAWTTHCFLPPQILAL